MRPPAEPVVVTSRRNAAVVAAAKLHRKRERRARGRTLLEGPHGFDAAVRSGAAIDVVFALEDDLVSSEMARKARLPLQPVNREVLERLAPSEHPRGPVAVLRVPDPAPLRETDTVVLMGVADPGNVGTIIRSAAAFGFDVAVGPGTADPWSPKTLRAGAGAQFHVSISELGSQPVDELHSAGLVVVATVPSNGATPESAPPEPTALLIGAEPDGLDFVTLCAADVVLTIPTKSVESLNAAVAGSILMYQKSLGRRQGQR